MEGRKRDGQLFQDILKKIEIEWQSDIFYLWQNQYPRHIDDYDAYIITGSPASVNDTDAWIIWLLDFIRQLHDRKIKTIGICFGHQAIAKALGSMIGCNPHGWSIGIEKLCMKTKKNWMHYYPQYLRLYSVHQEQILQASPKLEVIAGNDHCPIGSFVVGNHFLTVAYHPELQKNFLQDLCIHLQGHIDQPLLDKATKDFHDDSDSEIFIKWMRDFISLA